MIHELEFAEALGRTISDLEGIVTHIDMPPEHSGKLDEARAVLVAWKLEFERRAREEMERQKS